MNFVKLRILNLMQEITTDMKKIVMFYKKMSYVLTFSVNGLTIHTKIIINNN